MGSSSTSSLAELRRAYALYICRREYCSAGAYQDSWGHPASQANSALRSLVKEGAVAAADERGMYALPAIVQQEREEAAQAEEEAEAAVADDTRLTVKAYGLYWGRNLVDWSPTPASKQAQLLGNAGSGNVNFADQDGIYLLHSGNETVYAGQSYTPNTEVAGLYSRLRSHQSSSRKTDRWDTFSWFGFRRSVKTFGCCLFQIMQAQRT